MKLTKSLWKRWLLGSLVATALLVGGYYGARHVAWPAVKAWRVARMNETARAFLKEGDYANAILTARKSLQSTTQNPEAWRVAAQASDARQRPEAVWYQDSLSREQPTRENYLELIRLALRYEVPGFALGAIKAIESKSERDPAFHRMVAQIALRTGQPREARKHLVALTQLEPADRLAQLDLAEIGLAADSERKDMELRARVLALSDEPALRVRAITMLLRDNIGGRVIAGTEELVRRLQMPPDPGVAARLLAIQGMDLLGNPAWPALLAELQAEVPANPAGVAQVLEFFIRTGRSKFVQPWVLSLPPATREDVDIQHRVAEALLVLGDAPGLEAVLRGANWPGREYLRCALLAYAYRAQGRSAEFAEAWKLALIGTESDLSKTTALLARVDGWRWVNERHDVIWKLFTLVPTNESAQQALLIWERHQGNTANLNRLFARIVEVQPLDEVARNNLAYTSLLIGANVARAGLIAAELAAAKPDNPYYATTNALALYKKGNVAEALARLDALSAADRTEPIRRLIRALCLASLGQAAPASEAMNGVDLTGMLPEEVRLAEGGVAEIARLDRTQGNRSRLLALRQGQASGAGGWLALVAADTRSAATTDMQLADSLYAAPDWDALRDLLRATTWKGEEHLRAALLAYVYRQQGDLRTSQEEWRQALAIADRNPARLQNLRSMVTRWQWTPERLDTVNLIFERTPGDRLLLAELLVYYREARRTPDLMRVLGLYLTGRTDLSDEAVAHAYYSLLLDTNVARAHVVARSAFEAAPADLGRRMVYVFSLWKQRRTAEAVPLMSDVKTDATSDLVSIPLLRAVVQAQLGSVEAARATLAQFKPESALPEEVALADRISSQLASVSNASAPASP